MSISEKIEKITPLETLKDKFIWKPLFIKFGDRVDDVENYFSAHKASEFSLVLMHCSINKFNKEQLVDFISVYFFSTKYIDFLEKILTYEVNEIYIGGVNYTDSLFIKQSGWIKKRV